MRNLLLLFVAALASQTASAQVYRCTDAAGKITMTERPCPAGQTSARRDIPLSTELTPEQRQLAMEESRDRASSDRRAAIELMLRDGRVNDARLTARTPDERALVSQAAAAQAQRDKQARLAEENRRFTEHTQEQIKRMKR